MDDTETILLPVRKLKRGDSKMRFTVCSFLMSSSKSTRPGSAAVTRSYKFGNSISDDRSNHVYILEVEINKGYRTFSPNNLIRSHVSMLLESRP